jgi:PPOX class probable F420-dependent enzyme
MSTTTRGLERFDDQKTVILTTYRRDGRPVDTPVHIAVDGSRAFVRTYEGTGKIKRLRRRPEAELWPASNGTAPALLALLGRGATRRVGTPVRVRATELRGEASRQAGAALARKYPLLQGVVIPLVHRLQRTPTINLELVQVD